MKAKCHEIIESSNTSGEPVKSWVCYCGTTACLEMVNMQNLASIQQCKQVRLDELTSEEERRFYEKAFGKRTI